MEYFICHLKGARLLVGKGVTWCDQHCTILPVNGKSFTDLVALARFFIPHFCLGPLAFSNESQCNCVLPGVAIAWGMWHPQFLTASQPTKNHSLIQMITCHLTTKNMSYSICSGGFCLSAMYSVVSDTVSPHGTIMYVLLCICNSNIQTQCITVFTPALVWAGCMMCALRDLNRVYLL